MKSAWASAVLLAVVMAPPLQAQTGRELGIGAVGLARDSSFLGGAVTGALRISSRTRLAVTGIVGGGDGGTGVRAELAGHFLLNPSATRGAGFYGGGGLALEQQGATRGFIELVLGLETRPGSPSGWSLEAGLGGGVRVSVGWRRRWFAPRRLRR